MTNYALTVARRARDRVADPAHWCSGSSARRANGQPTQSADPEAVAWCSGGAVWVECLALPLEYEARRDVYDEIAHDAWPRANYDVDMITINDARPHDEVVAAWDRTIAELER